MKNVNLNHYQTLSLLENKELTLENSNDILEISENEIRLNHNGKTHKLLNANMVFVKKEDESHYFVGVIKRLLCEYLNIKPKEVNIKSIYDMEFIFTIHISQNCESRIYICPKKYALAKTQKIDSEESYTDSIQIGNYKRLGSSDYFFRWLSEDE